uniref:Mitogenactivated protein kinase 1a putative n=1 Tax=Albugo laibachii Nc14 TaxID=890382 RepID=F0WW14_9STRA|nr:mitogenactivated protein kinase 1a putative [Albugo laibachii Nc14]|eukprot:CCA25617.1 mitogenactivated protein kinase 1a putative [Albugo laibachii Nc14]
MDQGSCSLSTTAKPMEEGDPFTFPNDNKKNTSRITHKKSRNRTQSEGAVWNRASFRMGSWNGTVYGDGSDQSTDSSGHGEVQKKSLSSDINEKTAGDSIINDIDKVREDGCSGEEYPLSDMHERHSFPSLQRSKTHPAADLSQWDDGKGYRLPWCEHGKISERANEMMEDARHSLHGRENHLYRASAQRLSASQNPFLSTLGEKLAKDRNEDLADGSGAETDEAAGDTCKMEPQTESNTRTKYLESCNGASSLHPDTARELTDLGHYVRANEEPLYHEFVRWKGMLSRRSEWLRRVEKHFYVLEGKILRRFPSKEAYLATADEPKLHQATHMDPSTSSADRTRSSFISTSTQNAICHVYTLAGVKDSSTRVNGLTFITEDKKTLQLNASSPVEKVIWMRLGLEALVALPGLPVTPLDMEEFYAMLVVLYTAYHGNWRTDGDMAVTLPPPSEQVFTRFFRLLDKDVIFCSNYPPSVPFHGAFRGHEGVVTFMNEFAKHTLWTNFKIGGLSVENSIAVASGKEELENQKDRRKFIQNWVHKFTFSENGKLTRFEINGDVVAASAVFKVPGAATTLKLPQDFNEVDAEHGKHGVLIVRVMQGNGIKTGSTHKRLIKSPRVRLSVIHGEKEQRVRGIFDANRTTGTGSTTIAGIAVPVSLTRKLNTGINLLHAAATTAANSLPSYDSSSHVSGTHAELSNMTGPPRDLGDFEMETTNPLWNHMIMLPFSDVIGTCSLLIELVDQGRVKLGIAVSGSDGKVAQATVNIARYLMSARKLSKRDEEIAIASDSRWYTVSNTRGEYCGKILLGITCRSVATSNVKHSPETCSPPIDQTLEPNKWEDRQMDQYHPDTCASDTCLSTTGSYALQWRSSSTRSVQVEEENGKLRENRSLSQASSAISASMEYLSNPKSTTSQSSSQRRHGWAHVRLSPEASEQRSHSAGCVDATKASTARQRFPSPMKPSIDSIICKENDSMHTFIVCGAPFTIPRHYQLIKVCGRGAYGIVIAATNTLSGGNVAIKKVIDCIWHLHQLKQILREVRLIRHMMHENILSLMDLIPPPSYTDFRDVYMTIDLMEMDLHRIIYSKEILLDDHIRYFLYQILSGLSHMHKAGVLHRDLKPSNLLINSDCQLKICDFGLARTKEWDDVGMTEYVVTRWYRAPELLLGSTYGEGVDLWAAGCIFAEMLGRKPLFPGETYVHQLQLIMNVLGVPEEHSFMENPQANKLKGRQLLSQTHAVAGMDVSTLFPNTNPEAVDLLWKMLVFDVDKRISVIDALRHPYLSAYYNEEKENLQVEPFHYFDLDGLDEAELKELMFKEICYFHPEEMEKRANQQAQHPENFEKLPLGWVKRESRSVPGKYYYSHPKRGVSTWNRADVK